MSRRLHARHSTRTRPLRIGRICTGETGDGNVLAQNSMYK